MFDSVEIKELCFTLNANQRLRKDTTLALILYLPKRNIGNRVRRQLQNVKKPISRDGDAVPSPPSRRLPRQILTQFFMMESQATHGHKVTVRQRPRVSSLWRLARTVLGETGQRLPATLRPKFRQHTRFPQYRPELVHTTSGSQPKLELDRLPLPSTSGSPLSAPPLSQWGKFPPPQPK